MTADYRDLITRMAKELDDYRQLLLDDRTVTHRLSDEARAALADELAVPAPPANGEVAELVALLRAEAKDDMFILTPADLRRAAVLLQRQALVPVAVSERLPGLWDCLPWPQPSDKGCWCWMGRTVRGFYGNYVIWEQVSVVPMCREVYTHWLPAHALPLPEASE